MKTTHVIVASLVLGGSVLLGAAGCSDDEESARTFNCPKVGDKNCAQDPGATQATVDSCKACEPENRAYDACLGGPPKCDAQGKSEPVDLTKCQTELSALVKCVQGGGSSSSGGSDAGGG